MFVKRLKALHSLQEIGVLEYWSAGVLDFFPSLQYSITPVLHHSSTPSLQQFKVAALGRTV
jgi:hypothetical protein